MDDSVLAHRRAPLRLERLRVGAFRHLAEPADLAFGDGEIVILGRNGTGKTNLLLLLDSVATGQYQRFDGDPGDLELTARFRPMAVAGTLGTTLGGTVAVQRAAPTQEAPAPLIRLRAWSDSDEAGPPDVARESTTRSPQRSIHVDQPWMGGRFDEGLGAFRSLVEGVGSPDGIPGHLLEFKKPPTGGAFALTPAGLFLRMSKEEEPTANSDDLPWLAEAARAAGFTRLSVHPRFSDETATHRRYAGVALRGTLPDGTVVSDRGFSFGQKRIVAFFWFLESLRDALDTPGILVADELVNGMHHDAIASVSRVIRASGLQAFLASQNPLQFDHLEFASAADFQRRAVFCASGGSGWVWRNPTAEESALFFSHYEVGTQHVSEILRGLGMW